MELGSIGAVEGRGGRGERTALARSDFVDSALWFYP